MGNSMTTMQGAVSIQIFITKLSHLIGMNENFKKSVFFVNFI
jgi:hypothetical protein